MEVEDPSLIDPWWVDRHHRRVVFRYQTSQAIDLLELEGGGETAALQRDTKKPSALVNWARSCLDKGTWTDLELVELCWVEDAVFVDVAQLEDSAEGVDAFWFERLQSGEQACDQQVSSLRSQQDHG